MRMARARVDEKAIRGPSSSGCFTSFLSNSSAMRSKRRLTGRDDPVTLDAVVQFKRED